MIAFVLYIFNYKYVSSVLSFFLFAIFIYITYHSACQADLFDTNDELLIIIILLVFTIYMVSYFTAIFQGGSWVAIPHFDLSATQHPILCAFPKPH